MAIMKKTLRDHFDNNKTKPAARHPACRTHFEAACEENREARYLSDLERVLEQITAMQCLGVGKRHAQDERINRLLLSLMTNERIVSPRFRVELMEVINRRSARTGTKLREGKAFGCRAELHELRPLDERYEHHARRLAPHPAFTAKAFQREAASLQ